MMILPAVAMPLLGGVMVKMAGAEATPPEITVTLTVPGWVTSAAGTLTTTCVEVIEVGVSTWPLKFTVAFEAKALPVTVKGKLIPAVAVLGFSVVMTGAGVIWKISA